MGQNLQKIGESIIQSNLEPAEKEELIRFFSSFSDEKLGEVLQLFNSDASYIKKVSDNYQAKQAAFATGNSQLWDKIIKEEKTQLEEIEKAEK